VVLLGPSGCGKSTTLNIIAGLTEPSAGKVLFGEEDVTGLSPHQRNIAMVFQSSLLYPHLTARQNIFMSLKRSEPSRAAIERRIAEVAAIVDIDRLLDKLPSQLSGGERQRVALARALAGTPRVLILDEPLSAVDVSARAELRSLLRRTLRDFDGPRLLVTHDPVEAMTLADRVLVLEDGRITQTGTPDEIRDAPRTRYAADLVGMNLFAGRLMPLEAGAGVLETADGVVTVPWPEGVAVEPIDDVLATLAPADVALHAARPEGSARNVVEGVVEEVAILGDRARVRLNGSPRLVAEITTGSVARMAIRTGDAVWASFKAVEIHLMVERGPTDTL